MSDGTWVVRETFDGPRNGLTYTYTDDDLPEHVEPPTRVRFTARQSGQLIRVLAEAGIGLGETHTFETNLMVDVGYSFAIEVFERGTVTADVSTGSSDSSTDTVDSTDSTLDVPQPDAQRPEDDSDDDASDPGPSFPRSLLCIEESCGPPFGPCTWCQDKRWRQRMKRRLKRKARGALPSPPSIPRPGTVAWAVCMVAAVVTAALGFEWFIPYLLWAFGVLSFALGPYVENPYESAEHGTGPEVPTRDAREHYAGRFEAPDPNPPEDHVQEALDRITERERVQTELDRFSE